MEYDGIIIGSGINGLVTGIYLAKAGWRVLILERNEHPGGAIQTQEVTLPGFKHDLFATNLSAFASSAFYREFASELTRHGLTLLTSSSSFASVFPDKTYIGVSTDLDETLESIKTFSSEDAKQWQSLVDNFPKFATGFFPLMGQRIPSWGLSKVVLDIVRAGGLELLADIAQLCVSSCREFTHNHFENPRMHALFASWGMHLDFAPEIAGGGLFPYIESMESQRNGMALGQGGANTITNALLSFFKELGGEILVKSEVKKINIRNSHAQGVTLVAGESYTAKRAVIGNLSPKPLFEHLIEPELLSPGFRKKISQFQYGPASMSIHLAMSSLPNWLAGPQLQEFPYLHFGGYLSDMTQTYNEAMEGLLPANPLLIVAQPTTVDPSRAPEGKHILSIQVRMLPFEIKGDSLKQISGTNWDDIKEAFSERIIEQLCIYAPDIKDKILHKTLFSPKDIAAYNPNLVRGCNTSGSMHLRQNFLFRPFPGWSNYKTPIEQLYIVGASTWPGGGTGAGSGRLLGKMLT